MSRIILFSKTLKSEFNLLTPHLKKLFKKSRDIPEITLYDPNTMITNNMLFYITPPSDAKQIEPKLKPRYMFIDSSLTQSNITKNNLYLPLPTKQNYKEYALIVFLYVDSLYYSYSYESATEIISAYEKFSDYTRSELLETKKILDANEKVQELSRQELLDKDNVLQAEEKILEMSRKEQIFKDEYIQAQENVSQLAKNEILTRDTLLKAWDLFYEIVRKELVQLKKQIDAESNVLDLSTSELLNKDKIIKAFEQLNEWEREELINAQKTIKAEESVLDFNRNKLVQILEKIDSLNEDSIDMYLPHKDWMTLDTHTKTQFITFFKILLKSFLKNENSKGEK